jgi:hypothetical protein
MPGAVAVVEAGLPQRHARDAVQLVARDARREHRHIKRYVRLQQCGKK